MIYAVVVMGRTVEQALAEALGESNITKRHVYVVGMSESSALASALAGRAVGELEDPSAEDVMQFTYSEIVGMEDEHTLRKAKARAVQLQLENPSPIAKAMAKSSYLNR